VREHVGKPIDVFKAVAAIHYYTWSSLTVTAAATQRLAAGCPQGLDLIDDALVDAHRPIFLIWTYMIWKRHGYATIVPLTH
jgi:hypothetical protein